MHLKVCWVPSISQVRARNGFHNLEQNLMTGFSSHPRLRSEGYSRETHPRQTGLPAGSAVSSAARPGLQRPPGWGSGQLQPQGHAWDVPTVRSRTPALCSLAAAAEFGVLVPQRATTGRRKVAAFISVAATIARIKDTALLLDDSLVPLFGN